MSPRSCPAGLEAFVALRRDLHRHPELAFREHRTAGVVADTLRGLGYAVEEGIAGTGVVGTLARPGGSRSVALRADMDALPIAEESGVPHASGTPGLMHACGHDGHTAMLLAAAAVLAREGDFAGTLHLVFQPAEEVGEDSGAERMVREGLFDRFPADAVFAMHNHPGLPVGHFMCRPGAFMSASDKVRIKVQGRGGHAARPHLCVDASLAASAIVMSLQSVVSRNVDPAQTAVVSVGRLVAGDAYNVVPDTALLELSVRSFDASVRGLLRRRIEQTVQAQAQSYGATAEIDYVMGYPVLENDPAQTAFAADVAREVAGAGAVDDQATPIMGSEDFSYMLQARPGCLIRIGNGVQSPALHNPRYEFDDSNIAIGAAFWRRLVERFLSA